MHEHHGANRSVVVMYIQVGNWFGNCRWKDVIELTQIQSIGLQKIKSDFMPYFQLKTCIMSIWRILAHNTFISLYVYIRNSVRQ